MSLKEFLIQETACVDLRKKASVEIRGYSFDARIIKKFIQVLPEDFEAKFFPLTAQIQFKWANGIAEINDQKTAERLIEELADKIKSPTGGKWGNA